MEEVSGSGYSRGGREISWGDVTWSAWSSNWPPGWCEDPEPEDEPADDELAGFRVIRRNSEGDGNIYITLADGRQLAVAASSIRITLSLELEPHAPA